jgi:hypothetical protein
MPDGTGAHKRDLPLPCTNCRAIPEQIVEIIEEIVDRPGKLEQCNDARPRA